MEKIILLLWADYSEESSKKIIVKVLEWKRQGWGEQEDCYHESVWKRGRWDGIQWYCESVCIPCLPGFVELSGCKLFLIGVIQVYWEQYGKTKEDVTVAKKEKAVSGDLWENHSTGRIVGGFGLSKSICSTPHYM